MPRYHFHVHDGSVLPDYEGSELSDLDAARREAVKLAGSLLRDQAKTFWDGAEWHMDVTDGEGLILFSLTFIGTNAPATSG